MNLAGWLTQVLALEPPWVVEQATIDASSRRIDVVLGVKARRGLFQIRGLCPLCRTELPAETARVSLRHFNLGPFRVFLEAPEFHADAARRPACACARRWRRADSRYSLGFEQLVQQAIESGLNRAGLRTVFALSAEESSAFIDLHPPDSRAATPVRERMDGDVEVELLDERPAVAAPSAGTPVPAARRGLIPAADAPCWAALLQGRLSFRTESVSLVMLVERLRLSLSGGDAGRETAAIRTLSEYFERHARSLGRELAQLHEAPVAHSPEQGLPPIDHPAWLDLIEGRIPVRSEALGLQMLLERVRLALGETPPPSLRQAAARTVFDFFVRHGQRHRPELARMQGLAASSDRGSHEAARRELPPESDPVWRRLIRGDVDASRASLPLQLLLQRLRSELGANAKADAEQQAVRALRSFYLRAQGSQPRGLVSPRAAPGPSDHRSGSAL